MTTLAANWAEPVIAARKMLEKVAALAEDGRFDEAITACGDLQQLAGEARSAIWYAEREQAKRVSERARVAEHLRQGQYYLA